jgi:hypothetical protein
MNESGRIVAVQQETLGSELSANTSIGATTLPVVDTTDFHEDGGQVTLGAETLTYTAVDDDALTLTLSGTAAAVHTAADRVDVYPPAAVTWAYVQVGDEDDDPVIAEMPHALLPLVTTGVKDVDEYQSAILEERGGHWTVKDILGEVAGIVGTSIDVPDSGQDGFHVSTSGSVNIQQTDTADYAITIDGLSNYLFLVARGGGGSPELVRLTTALLELIGPIGSITGEVALWAGGDAGPKVILGGNADASLEFGNGSSSRDVRLRRSAASVLRFEDPTATGVGIEIATKATAPGNPPAGALRHYVTNDGSGHPQWRIKNSAGTVQTVTSFTDGA